MIKKSMRSLRVQVISAAALICILTAAVYADTDSTLLLKGKVHDLSNARTLQKGTAQAHSHFQKSDQGDLYFIGYEIRARRRVHMGECGEYGMPYRISVRGNKIKVRRKSEGREGYSRSSDEDKPGPAGILLLFQGGKNPEMEDFHLIDLEQEYEFSAEPVYWMGKRKNEESFAFITEKFQHAAMGLKESLLFAASIHPGDAAYDFLMQTALSGEVRDIQKNAVFWLGTFKDGKSFEMLQEIFRKTNDEKIQEHVIFALQLNDSEKAVRELIRIAKNHPGSGVRKKAVFWLGQKASEKSVQALQDVVKNKNEDSEVKESAVFALSRLPEKKSVPILIDIARNSEYPGVRKQAIFWLGQKSTPEALKFFEEILLKK